MCETLRTGDRGRQQDPFGLDELARQRAADVIKDFVTYARTLHGTTVPVTAPKTVPCAASAPSAFDCFSFAKLVDERKLHQNTFTSDAVRRGGNGAQHGPQPETFATSLKSQLAVRFVELLGKVANRAGYTRQQRWSAGSTDAPVEGENTASNSSAGEKHARLRETCYKQCFKDFAKVHPQLPSANVSSVTPLSLSAPQYVLVLMPGKKGTRRVAFGQVLAMYTLSSRRHASVDRVDTIGRASYISVQVFGTRKAGVMTSRSCATLGTSTFVHLPPRDIIFSFTTYNITRKVEIDEDGDVEVVLKLDTAANKIFSTAVANRKQLEAVNTAINKNGKVPRTADLEPWDVEESEDEDDEDGED
ncbi:hypothetical protein EXIGLDRAFT_693319 [Exidia glandulosa HHB12029]|uniref:Uncharacterized protein n=1 Tax=Exidia glandulosa HHB12029 TaxID=1314781 RepID=A0A165HDM8_EXIGL|nr:hypothetical protein EXIGLDRAFT_693319 [Exidia glandulosa HHB12029]